MEHSVDTTAYESEHKARYRYDQQLLSLVDKRDALHEQLSSGGYDTASAAKLAELNQAIADRQATYAEIDAMDPWSQSQALAAIVQQEMAPQPSETEEQIV